MQVVSVKWQKWRTIYVVVYNPTNMPEPDRIDYMEEPVVKATIMLPKDYVGNIMELCQERRGALTHQGLRDIIILVVFGASLDNEGHNLVEPSHLNESLDFIAHPS